MRVRLFGSDPPVEPAWRTLEYFALARVLVASALVLSVAAFGAPLMARGALALDGPKVMAGSLLYFALAAGLAMAAFFVRRRFMLQVAGQLGVDLAVISAMLVLGGGLRSGVMILYLLPLAGASLLLPTVAAFFVCSVAVIVLLADTFLRQLQGTGADALVFQAGLYGAALFAITGLLRLLSARLAAQERLAQLRGRDLESQLEINRLVIAQMEQGVIVVDADTCVRANNRAARLLLGMNPNVQLTGQRLRDFPALRPLTEAFARWLEAERAAGVWSNSMIQPVMRPNSAQPVGDLRLRARFARPPSDGSGEFVIFLEDVRAVEERAQQLKLAAMGRLTASIAHEIRNPLAAISHAGQLLAEEAQAPLQQRLTGIVRENTLRLNRLVEDVLRVARREPPLGDDIDLGSFAEQWLAEFVRDRAVAPGVIALQTQPGLDVRFGHGLEVEPVLRCVRGSELLGQQPLFPRQRLPIDLAQRIAGVIGAQSTEIVLPSLCAADIALLRLACPGRCPARRRRGGVRRLCMGEVQPRPGMEQPQRKACRHGYPPQRESAASGGRTDQPGGGGLRVDIQPRHEAFADAQFDGLPRPPVARPQPDLVADPFAREPGAALAGLEFQADQVAVRVQHGHQPEAGQQESQSEDEIVVVVDCPEQQHQQQAGVRQSGAGRQDEHPPGAEFRPGRAVDPAGALGGKAHPGTDDQGEERVKKVHFGWIVKSRDNSKNNKTRHKAYNNLFVKSHGIGSSSNRAAASSVPRPSRLRSRWPTTAGRIAWMSSGRR